MAVAGFSYYDVMLSPMANALNKALNKNTRVQFALQGEMTATVIHYPKQWAEIVPRLKGDIIAGKVAFAGNVFVSPK